MQSRGFDAESGRPTVDERLIGSLNFSVQSRVPVGRESTVRTGLHTSVDVMAIRTSIGLIRAARGELWLARFSVGDTWTDYRALVKAPLDECNLEFVWSSQLPIEMRLDSGCATGQLYGDQACDCGPQLENSLDEIAQSNQGVLIHIPQQDGRGHGLDHLNAALVHQVRTGATTVDADTHFELLRRAAREQDVPLSELRIDSKLAQQVYSAPPYTSSDVYDERTYEGSVAVLRHLGIVPGVHDLHVSTNNPTKLRALSMAGFATERIPNIVAPTELTRAHLRSKVERLGHELPG